MLLQPKDRPPWGFCSMQTPKKHFSQHCIEDVLWKVLALTVWWQWGLPVWGPHSWLWKYDVVSRCIWGCTSLSPSFPVSVWSVFKPRRPMRALLCCPGEHIVSVAASWISLWTLPLCLLSLILLHSAVTNWECTLSIPRGPPGLNSTCPLISNYPQLIISLGYCGNSSENILYATQATVKRFFCPPLSHNCQSIKERKIQWLWKGINMLPLKAHLGVSMHKRLQVKLKWAVCECAQ